MGFKKVYGPKSQLDKLTGKISGIDLVKVKNIRELVPSKGDF